MAWMRDVDPEVEGCPGAITGRPDVADGDPGWVATRRRKRSVDDGMRTVEYTRGRLYDE